MQDTFAGEAEEDEGGEEEMTGNYFHHSDWTFLSI